MPTTGAARMSWSTPPIGTASPQPTTAPLELVRKNPPPVGVDASPVQEPLATAIPVQPTAPGEAALPNPVGNRYTFRSQYPSPDGVAAIPPQPSEASSVLGGWGENAHGPAGATPEPRKGALKAKTPPSAPANQ